MPIPKLTSDGLLPPGEYSCTLEEIIEFFGEIPEVEYRAKLCEKLGNFVKEVKSLDIGVELIVNGSFTTTKERPNDIDVFLVLKDTISREEAFSRAPILPDMTKANKPFWYGYRSIIDFYHGHKSSIAFKNLTNTFQRLRNDPQRKKGYLRVKL
ncbi:MAG: hypothetical protein U9Q76_03260 [candidate division WOR-3 bacterium]|nr:hypothetical protein [candidate division WOR-3 bacterium]